MRSLILFFAIVVASCASPTNEERFYVGADLSYVNELLDCGAEYRAKGIRVDPYTLFAQNGTDIVRLRLWHNPLWTNYSNFEDVQLAIERSKQAGMQVLLDFHYSDTWADPQHQVIPAAWAPIEDPDVLIDSLYRYTYGTLAKLHNEGLLPEFVQVGNEINIEIMQPEDQMVVDTIDWARNMALINAGLQAVTDFSRHHQVEIERMLHIAQPENALWWFDQASRHGLEEYDWIGLSYYPKWSSYGLDSLSIAIESLRSTYDKELMIVETAYPHSLYNVDSAGNILMEDALIPGFPATQEGQYNFMAELIQVTKQGGGKGVLYWEPAWVTSLCSTRWGQGSHWENSTFFDPQQKNEALPIFELFANN